MNSRRSVPSAVSGSLLHFASIDYLEAKLSRFTTFISRSRRNYFIVYCIAFAAFFFLYSYSLIKSGESFIWAVDGIEQQYNFFILESNWLHELLRNIFVLHSFTVPMWTDTVGYGADYIISICNTLGNPINLLAVFATAETAEFWLTLTVPVTLFCAGITFSNFCFYHGFDKGSTLVGCFVYLFSGFSIIAFSQIYMLYPLVVAPIAFLGFDKVLNRESPACLIAGIALMCLYSASTAYMLCLVLGLYGVVRFATLDRKDRSVRCFLGMVGRALVPLLLGILVASALFVPMGASILGQSRLGVERDQSLLYDSQYYFSILRGFISYSKVGADCLYGFAPIAVLCLLLSLRDRSSESRVFKAMIAVSIVVLCVPFLGRVTNGFAYPNNRWVWAFVFFMGVLTVITLPRIWNKGIPKRLLAACAVVCTCSVLVIPLTKDTSGLFLAGMCVLIGSIVLFYCCGRRNAVVLSGALLSVALSTAIVFYTYGALVIAKNEMNIPAGQAYAKTVEKSGLQMAKEQPDSSVYRTDSVGLALYRNSNIAAGILGSSFYNSLYNNYIDEYHTSVGLISSTMNFSFDGFDARSALEALAGTKYFLTSYERDRFTPPLFSHLIDSQTDGGSTKFLYESSDCLPLAYFANGVLSRSAYDECDFVERENALLENVVLEDADYQSLESSSALSLPSNNYVYSSDLPFSMSTEWDGSEDLPDQIEGASEAIQINGNTIVTSVPNAVVYLDVDIPADTEANVLIDGLRYLNSDGQSGYDSKVYVYGDGMGSCIWNAGYRDHLYGGKDSWCANTGYSDQDRHVIALRFEEAGTYQFDDLKVVAEQVSWIPGTIQSLSENGVTNASLQENTFSCEADSNEDGLVYIRIPYAEGWHAKVNGKDADIVRANIGFMAVEVGEGHNDIVLTYESPYIGIGSCLSLLGVVLSLGYCFWTKKTRASRKPFRLR